MVLNEQQENPSRPSLMKSLMAGFDAVSSHVWLIVLPVALDLVLWFGPRLRVFTLLQGAFKSAQDVLAVTDESLLDSMIELINDWNLLTSLRTFPVGVPSLMVSRVSLETPLGTPLIIELSSVSAVLSIWLACGVIGLVAGAFYFLAVSQVSIENALNFKRIIKQWPFTSLQVTAITIMWFILIFLAMIPFTCLLTLLLIGGVAFEQIAFIAGLVYLSLLIWMLVPLVFSVHGVVARGRNWWVAVRESLRISRLTMPSTSLLFLVLVLLSQGLDILWNVPDNSSWFTLVGVLGHAFVVTSLIAASFVYYNDAYLWVKAALEQAHLSPWLHNK